MPALSGSAGASQAPIINEASFINYLPPGREVPHPGNALLEAPGETLRSGGDPLGSSTRGCPFPPQHKGSVGSSSRSLGGIGIEWDEPGMMRRSRLAGGRRRRCRGGAGGRAAPTGGAGGAAGTDQVLQAGAASPVPRLQERESGGTLTPSAAAPEPRPHRRPLPCQECPSGLVDEETFTLIYSRFFPQGDASTYAHFLFDAFDADRNGALCFQVIHELFLRDHCPALAGAGARVDAGTAAPASPRGLKIAASENGNGINRDKTQFPPGRPPAPVQGCEMRVPSLGSHRDVPTQPQFLRQDFVLGLSVLLRGTVQQKLQWAFNLYDINKDGCITKEEMLEIMTSIYDMMGRCTQPALRDCAPAEHVELFFQKMDRNGDGVVTFEEFLDTCLKDEDIMSSMRIFEDVL
ncbi:uncharacterized protein LOC134171778 isoform X1 [Pezoporus occidentalis]|uniref:uncharacterized protein LOC134171778 isoform X1 n=1 Tax=Pezoporus occidentalis TaxID=407982 RepID=UPI002F90D247